MCCEIYEAKGKYRVDIKNRVKNDNIFNCLIFLFSHLRFSCLQDKTVEISTKKNYTIFIHPLGKYTYFTLM